MAFPRSRSASPMLVYIWYEHRQFFNAYRLTDAWTVALNSLLLFTVLLYVYPLKLLTEVIAERFLGAAPEVMTGMGSAELQGLFVIYGAGWTAVFAVFAALHGRAWQLRRELTLDELGRYETTQGAVVFGAVAAVGVLSIITAAIGVGLSWGLPGWVYLLAPALSAAHRAGTSPRRRELSNHTTG